MYRFYEPGLPATREVLQQLRAEVAREVTTQFNIKLTPATQDNDPVTIVTKRDGDLWTLTGDIRIQFASPDQARAVYHQQRGQRSGNQTGCLRTYNDHRCYAIIPNGTTRPPPEDRDLYRIYLGCDAFRGESQLSVEGLLRESLVDLWNLVLETSAEADLEIDPNIDHISALSRARTEAESDGKDYIQLRSTELLYLLEYSSVTKLGQSSPFVKLEFPGTQIPQALTTLVVDQDLLLAIPKWELGGNSRYSWLRSTSSILWAEASTSPTT